MLRLAYVLIAFFATVPLYIAALWIADKLKPSIKRTLTLRYCRYLCALLRVRVTVQGAPNAGQPTLILANHVSWLDILVMHAIAPVAFVARHEVASWPLIGITSQLMGTVFVDRTRRQDTAAVNSVIAWRLRQNDPVVLFAEATSSDGNRVLPFRSALVGTLLHFDAGETVMLQPACIGYTHLDGVPMDRRERPLVAWYGDLDFTPHFKEFARRGSVDVTVTFGTPVPFRSDADRKALTRAFEADVRRMMTQTLRGRRIDPAQSKPRRSWIAALATSAVRSLPLKGGGLGWGSTAHSADETPTRFASQTDLPLSGGGVEPVAADRAKQDRSNTKAA